MTTNEIRSYLHHFDNLQLEVKNLQESLRVYKEMDEDGVKAQVITDMPICHSGPSKVEELACRRVEEAEKIKVKIDKGLRLINAVNSVYFYMQEPKRSIFEMRYFITPIGQPKLSWYQISREVIEPVENCRQIDTRILSQIQSKLNN